MWFLLEWTVQSPWGARWVGYTVADPARGWAAQHVPQQVQTNSSPGEVIIEWPAAVASQDRQMVSHDWFDTTYAAYGSGLWLERGAPFSCLVFDVSAQVLQKEMKRQGQPGRPQDDHRLGAT